MARHRNVRTMKFDDDFCDDDDGYSHSVDDHYCISPGTVAEFTYNRDKRRDLENYLKETEIQEESESEDESLGHHGYVLTENLSDSVKARLANCVDEIRSVMGDAVADDVVQEVVLRNNFKMEQILDELLNFNDRKSSTNAIISNGKINSNAVSRTDKVQDIPECLSTTTLVSDSSSQLNCSMDKEKETAVNKDQTKATSVFRKDRVASPAPKVTPTKSRLSAAKIQEEYVKRRGKKDLINLIVMGHVDAGKSTLMGHLLYQIGCVNQRVMHRYKQDSQKAGKSSFAYAWVLDETDEERTRGVTMDVAQTKFETERKVVTLLDAPGHKDFIPNMITGAAQADVAILVINATKGEFETGFETGGQTREHSLLARSLGISQVIVVINKMDTVDWSEQRYQEIVRKLSHFMKQIGFKDADLSYIPCSGLSGENLLKSPAESKFSSWYAGNTLVQQIEKFQVIERSVESPVRICVNDVYKAASGSTLISAKVSTGVVQTGDRLLVMPSAEFTTVKNIYIDEESTPCAFVGDYISLSLGGIDSNLLSIGSILCDPSRPVEVTTKFRARIIVFNISVPITKGFPVVLHYQTVAEPAVVRRLVSLLNKTTGEVVKKSPKCLTKHSHAIVEVSTERALCLESYRDFKDLGRFTLRSSGVTIGAGLIESVSVSKPSR